MCRSVFRIAYPGKKYLISVIFLSKGEKNKIKIIYLNLWLYISLFYWLYCKINKYLNIFLILRGVKEGKNLSQFQEYIQRIFWFTPLIALMTFPLLTVEMPETTVQTRSIFKHVGCRPHTWRITGVNYVRQKP